MEVRFENLDISVNVQVGSRALPTLVNNVRNHIEVSCSSLSIVFKFSRSIRFDSIISDRCELVFDLMQRILTGLRIFRPKRHRFTILNDISGLVKPGR